MSKFCLDAGFVHVVEIGQYFTTKDTQEQFFAWGCRECTHPRNMNHHKPKVGFRKTRELDLYWKLRPVVCIEKMELKSESGL